MLLPEIGPEEIKCLNVNGERSIALPALNVDAEIDRALSVARPCFPAAEHQIHFVGEHLDVACNVAIWNREMETEAEHTLEKASGVVYLSSILPAGSLLLLSFVRL